MGWEEALAAFKENLTTFEQEEIKAFGEIYYVNYHSLADQSFLD